MRLRGAGKRVVARPGRRSTRAILQYRRHSVDWRHLLQYRTAAHARSEDHSHFALPRQCHVTARFCPGHLQWRTRRRWCHRHSVSRSLPTLRMPSRSRRKRRYGPRSTSRARKWWGHATQACQSLAKAHGAQSALPTTLIRTSLTTENVVAFGGRTSPGCTVTRMGGCNGLVSCCTSMATSSSRYRQTRRVWSTICMTLRSMHSTPKRHVTSSECTSAIVPGSTGAAVT